MGERVKKKKVVEETCYELAQQRISHAFDIFDEVVVSFSGGKDSTVVLEMTLAEAEKRGRLPLRVVFYDEEAIPLQTVEYIERRRQDPRINLEWYCVPLELRNACSQDEPAWYSWAPEDKDKWVRPLPEGAITSHPLLDDLPREKRPGWPDFVRALADGNGSTAFMLGIRAEESLSRFRQVAAREEYNYVINYGAGIAKVLPIYDFTTEDVWTAPAVFGWDYNEAYDLMEMLGIKPSQQRCAPPFGEEPLGGLWVFAQAFPEIWDKMIDRAPGVAAAARYARTELYGFGGSLEKPNGVTWKDFIYETLDAQPDDIKAGAVRSIKTLINGHYKRIDTPIPERHSHPATGITWRKLLSIAMRGDTKGRRMQMAAQYALPGTAEYDARLKAYEEEIDELEKSGRIVEVML
jgi:predicted phosphoadenosine phosphosulfate sulfurtransferase